jgi:competence protein ComEC
VVGPEQGTGDRIGDRGAAGAEVASRGPRALDLLDPSRRAELGLRLAAAATAIGDAIESDLGRGLGFALLVVAFAFGAAFYFVAPAEPWWPATVAVAAGLGLATVVLRRRGSAARGLAVAAALAAGFSAGAIETVRVAAPRLDHERTVSVVGRVGDLDATVRGGTRITLEVARMEAKGLAPASTPTRITATLTGRGGAPAVGDGVSFLARLKPPEGPVLPGGYDFARRAWFEGRGASGYVLGRVKPVDLGPPSLADRIFAPIGALRHAIAERVRASLPGAAGAIGAAIMVGEQRAIPDAANEVLRASGLTHIVSISGLHMSLVAGGVMGAVRLVLALFPAIALRHPIRKWAAAAAIVAATVYLFLSGNQVAALRSHLMLTIALVAVILDRPALTMHTIAVSAAAILVVDPSAALEPSFQMSYLAVIALVASWDLWRLWLERRPPPEREAGLVARAFAGAVLHVQGLAFSSLIAGLATAPVIAGVFYRGAPYSILANMIVLPVTGMLIMPAAVLAALAMPFGLDPWPLAAMGAGIDFMVAVGAWVSAFPGGAGLLGVPHPAMMPLGIVAVLWLSVFSSRFRLFGAVPAVAAMVLLFCGPRPDVLVGRHGSPVAVRDVDGRLAVLATRQDRFDAAIWLASDADSRPPEAPGLAAGWRCDPLGCVFRRPAGVVGDAGPGTADGRAGAGAGEAPDVVVAVVRHPRGFDEDCRRATLVVTALVAPAGCRERTTVIDRTDLARDGATTLRIAGPSRAAPAPVVPRLAPPVDPTEEEAAPLVATAEETDGAPRPVADARSAGARRTAAAAVTSGVGGLASLEGEDEFEEPVARLGFRRTSSLPHPARPWTPIDPSVVVADGGQAARSDGRLPASATTPAGADEPADPPGAEERPIAPSGLDEP